MLVIVMAVVLKVLIRYLLEYYETQQLQQHFPLTTTTFIATSKISATTTTKTAAATEWYNLLTRCKTELFSTKICNYTIKSVTKG